MLMATISVPAFWRNDQTASRTRSSTTDHRGHRQPGSSITKGCGGPRNSVRDSSSATMAAVATPTAYMPANTTAGSRSQGNPTAMLGTNPPHSRR